MNINPTSRTCLHVPKLSESEYAAQQTHCNCICVLPVVCDSGRRALLSVLSFRLAGHARKMTNFDTDWHLLDVVARQPLPTAVPLEFKLTA